MNPIRILVCLVLYWKFLEIISRFYATLSAIGWITATWQQIFRDRASKSTSSEIRKTTLRVGSSVYVIIYTHRFIYTRGFAHKIFGSSHCASAFIVCAKRSKSCPGLDLSFLLEVRELLSMYRERYIYIYIYIYMYMYI